MQFNDGGSFGGDSDLIWNKTTNSLTATGQISTPKLNITAEWDEVSATPTGGLVFSDSGGTGNDVLISLVGSNLVYNATNAVAAGHRWTKSGVDHMTLTDTQLALKSGISFSLDKISVTGTSAYGSDPAGGITFRNVGGTANDSWISPDSSYNIIYTTSFDFSHKFHTYKSSNAVLDSLHLIVDGGTPGAGFGNGIRCALKSSTTADQDAGRLSWEWATATHASRKALSKWTVYDTAEREGVRIEADGSNPMLGFYGTSAVVQPATTGTTTGFTAGSGTAANDDSTFTGNTGSAAYTIGDIVLALKQVGLLAA